MVDLSLSPDDNITDDDLGPHMLKVLWSLLAISTIVCLARFAVKLKMARRLYWDDAMLFLSLVSGFVFSVMITIQEKHGLGKHLFTIPLRNIPDILHYGYAALAPGFLAPMFGRLSFCIFLLFASGENRHVRKWPLYLFMVIQVVINVASVIFLFSVCKSKLYVIWTLQQNAVMQDCMPLIYQTYWQYAAGSMNTVTDLFLTVYPAVIVSYSRLSWRSRIGMMVLLCLSFIAMIASIKKTIESIQLSSYTDYTYDLISYVIWIGIELNIVIIVTSIPLMRPYFRRKGLSMIHGRDVVDEMVDMDVEAKKTGSRSGVKTFASSIASREKSVSRGPDPFVVTRTVEVYVTSEPKERNQLHAALIGLPID